MLAPRRFSGGRRIAIAARCAAFDLHRRPAGEWRRGWFRCRINHCSHGVDRGSTGFLRRRSWRGRHPYLPWSTSKHVKHGGPAARPTYRTASGSVSALGGTAQGLLRPDSQICAIRSLSRHGPAGGKPCGSRAAHAQGADTNESANPPLLSDITGQSGMAIVRGHLARSNANPAQLAALCHQQVRSKPRNSDQISGRQLPLRATCSPSGSRLSPTSTIRHWMADCDR